VDGSDVPAVSGQRLGYDGLQRGVGNSGAWSVSAIVSRRAGGERPEEAQRRRASGARFPAR
jgi:hypothetical protein